MIGCDRAPSLVAESPLAGARHHHWKSAPHGPVSAARVAHGSRAGMPKAEGMRRDLRISGDDSATFLLPHGELDRVDGAHRGPSRLGGKRPPCASFPRAGRAGKPGRRCRAGPRPGILPQDRSKREQLLALPEGSSRLGKLPGRPDRLKLGEILFLGENAHLPSGYFRRVSYRDLARPPTPTEAAVAATEEGSGRRRLRSGPDSEAFLFEPFGKWGRRSPRLLAGEHRFLLEILFRRAGNGERMAFAAMAGGAVPQPREERMVSMTF